MTAGTLFGRELLIHLDEQHRSFERLHVALELQAQAIHDRDVDAVLRQSGLIEVEATFRGTVEARRQALLHRGAGLLGVDPRQVTLTDLCQLVEGDEAEEARGRSDRLIDLLEEVRRLHDVNRALLRQEIIFLEHLLSLSGRGGTNTYAAPRGARRRAAAEATAATHALDLQA